MENLHINVQNMLLLCDLNYGLPLLLPKLKFSKIPICNLHAVMLIKQMYVVCYFHSFKCETRRPEKVDNVLTLK